jgi:hypothetical protein
VEFVSVEPIKKAVLEYIDKGNTWSQIAERMGWMHPLWLKPGYYKGDIVRVQRLIGYSRYHSKGHWYIKKMVRYDLAVKLIEAIEREPYEFDL